MALTPRSTATIAQALRGIDFPCRRQQMVEYARRNNADESALDVLKGMPDERYESMADVFKGVGLSHAHAPAPPMPKPEAAGRPPRPVQPQRAKGRAVPTEPPELDRSEGQKEAGRPHATDSPPQAQPETEKATQPETEKATQPETEKATQPEAGKAGKAGQEGERTGRQGMVGPWTWWETWMRFFGFRR